MVRLLRLMEFLGYWYLGCSSWGCSSIYADPRHRADEAAHGEGQYCIDKASPCEPPEKAGIVTYSSREFNIPIRLFEWPTRFTILSHVPTTGSLSFCDLFLPVFLPQGSTVFLLLILPSGSQTRKRGAT